MLLRRFAVRSGGEVHPPGVVPLENLEMSEEMRVIVVSESSLPMQLSLTTLFATLSSLFRSRAALELENLALRHQIGIFQRSARKRPKLAPWDRLLWVWFSRLKSHWRSALAIVQPETVVAWHRADFRLFLELEGAARKTRTAGDYPRGSRVAPDETATVGPNQVAKSNTA